MIEETSFVFKVPSRPAWRGLSSRRHLHHLSPLWPSRGTVLAVTTAAWQPLHLGRIQRRYVCASFNSRRTGPTASCLCRRALADAWRQTRGWCRGCTAANSLCAATLSCLGRTGVPSQDANSRESQFFALDHKTAGNQNAFPSTGPFPLKTSPTRNPPGRMRKTHVRRNILPPDCPALSAELLLNLPPRKTGLRLLTLPPNVT